MKIQILFTLLFSVFTLGFSQAQCDDCGSSEGISYEGDNILDNQN